MIALCCKEHILLCMIVHTPVKAEHLYLIFEYLIPSFALNTVHGQEQSKGLLKRKSSFQNFILFAEWGIGHKNVPMFGFILEKILTLLQAASLHFIAFFRKKLIESTPFLIERTPYLLVFRKKLQ